MSSLKRWIASSSFIYRVTPTLVRGRILPASTASVCFSNPVAAFHGSSNHSRLRMSPFIQESRARKSTPMNTVVKFVPQQEAWIVERMGRFNRVLEPGLAILIPILDSIKYVQSLKEVAVEVPSQAAITQDNVTIQMDGVLYYKVVDPVKASYGIEDAEFAVTQLAQTTMRSEIGQMTLDRTLAERSRLNTNIVAAINHAAADWGIQCLRYEIRDIHPPERVVEAMHSQVSAERSKRAEILESEGSRQAAINVAEGKKQSVILASEATKMEQINQAVGEAEAILARANATAKAIASVSKVISESSHAKDAMTLSVAEKYVEAWGNLAKEGTMVVVPQGTGDVASLIAQSLGIYNTVSGKNSTFNPPSPIPSLEKPVAPSNAPKKN